MSKKGYIYKYTFPNGKVYIGQTTTSVEQRWYEHLSNSKRKFNVQVCDAAIRKYGRPKIETLEEVEVEDKEITKLIEILNELERKYIAEYDATNRAKGYNMMLGGERAPLEQQILEEKWYELFEKDKWGWFLGYYQQLLESIKNKLFDPNAKLTKEEKQCWYGYKFMDYEIEKETTFSGFYRRNIDNPIYCDIGDVPYEILEAIDNVNLTEKEREDALIEQNKIFFDNIIKGAMDNWIEDIRQTIWKQVMKEKEKIIKEWR